MIPFIIVDDELLMRIGLKWMLDWESLGFRLVGEASNGQEALELAERLRPSLIITDIKMPVMDGLALIREASRLLPDCQFVIMSVLDEFQYAQEAIRLGASDYLIKGDIKPEQLQQVLAGVRRNLEKLWASGGGSVLAGELKEGIGYLKETLFKELISGFRGGEEVAERREALHIALEDGPILLTKLRIDRFEEVRQKYQEQDEKLLRYAVVNVIEELVSRSWNREIIIESSSEYLLFMNLPASGEASRETLDSLFATLVQAMRDFLGISVSLGVSAPASGFHALKRAFQEAEAAIGELFFREEAVRYCEPEAHGGQRETRELHLDQAEMAEFRRLVLTDDEGARRYAETIRSRCVGGAYSEKSVRQLYARLLLLIMSAYPHAPEEQGGAEGQRLTPYERILLAERLVDLHELLLETLRHQRDSRELDAVQPKSYAQQACDIVIERYADEDISLQTVADAISVNASYLSRVFKQEIGVTFVSFLTRLRIDQAKYYLKQRHLKIYEVASRVGYSNTTYFSKLFKKVTGVSPEEYRGQSS